MRVLHRPMVLCLLLLALLIAAPVAVAQEATPAERPATDTTSILADLGFPDLVLTTDGTTLDFPSETAAGRYRLVVENSNAERVAPIYIAMPPPEMSSDEAIAVMTEAATGEALPDAFFELTFVGGAFAMPESSADAILTFAPGDYVIWSDAYTADGEGTDGIQTFHTFTATGELPELEDVPADVTVGMVEMSFEMPETVPAGPQIWQVDNNGAFIHFIEINSYPEPVTREQVQATLEALFGLPSTPMATPIELLDPGQFVTITRSGLLSPTHSGWYAFDLEPGTYVAFCWVSGPGDVPPHLLLGMYAIFTVE